MKKLILALALFLLPSLAMAQCNGVFPNNTACGNITGSNNTPRAIPLSSFPTVTPGGTNGQVQYNNSGAFGGLTNAQLTALINPFSASLPGAVPASGGSSTALFLNQAGGFTAPPYPATPVGWRIANFSAINDVTFPTIEMRLNADWVQLYNPITQYSQFIPPGTVTANLPSATNSQGAGGSDVHSTSTVTISIASPAVVSWTAHGLHAGDLIYFTTTGALPTGLVVSTRYYVASAGLTTNAFEVTATRGGSAINTSGTQSGTQTGNAGVYLATAPVTNGTGVGDQVWFYYIWGSSPGLNTLNSSWGPTDTNGAGTLGPYLPSGYTHYAPAFPVVWSSNSLQPNWGLSGPTNIRVRGNHVYFPNVPYESLTGFPSNAIDLSGIIPPSYLTMDIYADLEMTYASGGGIGGCSLSTTEGAFWNASLYSAGTLPAAMDGTINGIYSPNRVVTFTFSHSSGTPNNNFTGIGPVGYTFPQ